MKYAVSFPGNDYLHLSDELYDLPEAIFTIKKLGNMIPSFGASFTLLFSPRATPLLLNLMMSA